MSSGKGNDMITSIVLGLIILGLFLFFMKRSGKLDEMRDALHDFGREQSQ